MDQAWMQKVPHDVAEPYKAKAPGAGKYFMPVAGAGRRTGWNNGVTFLILVLFFSLISRQDIVQIGN